MRGRGGSVRMVRGVWGRRDVGGERRRASGDIVVGHDGSVEADRALQWALRHFGGGTLVVVHAGATAGARERDFADRASRFAEAFTPAGLSITARHIQGHPVSVLVEASAHGRLLVVGRRGRGGHSLPVQPLGSTAAGVLAHAQCPVAVVPRSPYWPADHQSATPGSSARPLVPVWGASGRETWDPWADVRSQDDADDDEDASAPILVGVSGGADDAAIVDAALRRATPGHSVRIVHVCCDDTVPVEHDAALARRVRGREKAARAQLIVLLNKVGADFTALRTEPVVRIDRPAQTLLDEAGMVKPQLIVVGARGRGGFAGLSVGATATALAAAAPCPVMVVRTPPNSEE